MSTTPPAIQDLARQLLAGEPARVESFNGDVDRAVRACGKLRVPLTKLAGAAGFSSLMSRALALAKRESPLLESLRVEDDGSLVGSNAVAQDADAAEAAQQGGVLLVAELLNLLITFVGSPLTMSVVREAWPDATVDDVNPSTKGTP